MKYGFTGEEKYIDRFGNPDGEILVKRIIALRDFGEVKQGEIGGWIESEKNLSHEGNCWVFDEAIVFDNARISGDVSIEQRAKIFDSAYVHGEKMRVTGHAMIFEKADVFCDYFVYKPIIINGFVRIRGNSKVDSCNVEGCAEISDCAVVIKSSISDFARINRKARVMYANVRDHALVTDSAIVGLHGDCEVDPDISEIFLSRTDEEEFDYKEKAEVFDNAVICGKSMIGDAKIYENAIIGDEAVVYYDAEVHGEAKVLEKAICCYDADVYGTVVAKGKAILGAKYQDGVSKGIFS